ncbi:DUF572-domain-containing protein [Xylona heveae TC161]|uniref:Splicing factor YJU2 n=1 Tax=Xylona heveae (strain CBS 132557 / TC161) TaxID=1328760 RepID=A0A165AAT2_XYLHT|nr:DUF572-domain-containing protein [Xylona heveae TC161]KZF20185.1 DUF572-domain-containing protein [Xylona heveae TC161]
MSERKVLTKYYPPDFDPSAIKRVRKPKDSGPKSQTVRLMAPFSMRCTMCGEYIYKGRKFNARKETTEEKYYSIPIFRFYIRCTRCSGEITFKTDPKNMDYTCERGAKRNFEPWRDQTHKEETEEERLDRLEREEQEEEEEKERNAMAELENKTTDAKREMAIADALDEIRTRNARNERSNRAEEGLVGVRDEIDDWQRRQDMEDEELARRAFMTEDGDRVRRLGEEEEEGRDGSNDSPEVDGGVLNGKGKGKGKEVNGTNGEEVEKKVEDQTPAPTFRRAPKKKKDFSAALGIKKKPALV